MTPLHRIEEGREGPSSPPRRVDNCAALARLARGLRPIRRPPGDPAAPPRGLAPPGPLPPRAVPDLPAPPAGRGFAAPVARYALAHGLIPEDPIEAGDTVRFADASAGSELVDWRWDFGDGTGAAGPIASTPSLPAVTRRCSRSRTRAAA